MEITPQFLKESKVRELTGLSKSTLQRLMDRRKFPQPVRLSCRLNLWKVSDLEEWMKSPMEYRAAEAPKPDEETAAIEQVRHAAISARMKAWHARRAAEKAAA